MSKELTKIAIREYFKAKAVYDRLLMTSCGRKLEDARTEYEHAEAVLRSHSGTEERFHDER